MKVAIEFATKNCSTDLFEIELFDNPLVQKWIDCLVSDQTFFQNKMTSNCAFLGPLFSDLPKIQERLKIVSKNLHESGIRQFPVELNDFSPANLVELHKIKENLSPFILSGFQSTKIDATLIKNLLLEINVLIHQAECLQPGSNTNRICFFPPRKTRRFVETKDIPFFGTEYLFGHVYLDYFTNGRSPLEMFISKQKHTPVCQKDLGSRFWLSLQSDFVFDQKKQLQDWLDENRYFGENPNLYPLSEAPLGKITNYSDQKELLERASQCLSITRIACE